MKKVFIISAVLLIVVIIFWLIFTFLIKSKEATSTNASDTVQVEKEPNNQPTSLREKVSNITSVQISAATAVSGSDSLNIWTLDGRAVEMTQRGTNQKEIAAPSLASIIGAVWDPSGTELILRTSDGLNTKYNPSTKELIRLKSGLDYVEWSDLPGRILYKFFDADTGQRTLNISDANGLNWQKLADIPYKRVSFSQIPNTLRVAFWPDGDAFTETRLETVSAINPAGSDVLMTQRFGADFLFSPDGQRVLVSSTLDRGGQQITMGVANAQGAEYQNLQIPTIISKTVWSKDNRTVYYAQPNDIPAGSVMPNDYKSGKFTTRDTLWKVDVTTGKKERIISLEDLTEQIDATEMFLSSEEDAIFFINKTNKLLYRMNL